MQDIIIVRRKKLGRTSCREIANLSSNNVKVWRSDRSCPMSSPNMVIRWGCTASLPDSSNVLNTASAIHQVNDKLGFRRLLNNHGLCPETWFSRNNEICGNWPIGEGIPTTGGLAEPYNVSGLVVRPARHAQGRNLHVVNTNQELNNVCQRYGEGNYYISKLINKVAEYRVFVVSGRVACVAEKTPGNPQDVAWNVAQGGRFDSVRWSDWNMAAVETAVAAFNLTSLDFGGVDVMVDADGRAYVLEINSAPSLTSPYRQECMAKCFDFIAEHGKERLQLGSKYRRDTYYNYIHPAISEKAHVPEVLSEAA